MILNQEVAEEPFDLEATRTFFEGVAHARYVIRRVTRIVDDQAKREGLEPLEHQTLIQVGGTRDRLIQINELAERLDIVPAFASRLVRDLESKGLVKRGRSEEDRRVTLVEITKLGAQALVRINERVKLYVDVFKDQLSDDARVAAFRIFGFYVGMPVGNTSGEDRTK